MDDIPRWIHRKGPLQALAWVAIALVVYVVLGGDVRELADAPAETAAHDPSVDSPATIAALRADHAEEVWVTVEVTLERVLPDDTEGSAHQRMIGALSDGETLLIVHNIDLAPRVPAAVGDTLRVHGTYVWNPQGGLVHWTHHDPGGDPGGWIEHAGQRYE